MFIGDFRKMEFGDYGKSYALRLALIYHRRSCTSVSMLNANPEGASEAVINRTASNIACAIYWKRATQLARVFPADTVTSILDETKIQADVWTEIWSQQRDPENRLQIDLGLILNPNANIVF